MYDFSIDRQQFLSQVYERNVWLERRAFRPTFDWTEVDRALHVMEPMCSYARLHDGHALVPQSEYTQAHQHVGLHSHRFIKDALYRHLREGSTLIIDRMEIFSSVIKQHCDVISAFAGQPVVANGYAAFGERESFGHHWDTHDVFAVQLIGRKRWRVYPPSFALPMPEHTSKSHRHACPEQPVLDIYLEAGDVLYVPRGWWHCVTSVNEESFHLAIGVHPAKLAHYASWVCQHLLTQHLCARQSISSVTDPPTQLEELADCLRALLLDQAKLGEFMTTLNDYNKLQPGFNLSSAMQGLVTHPSASSHQTRGSDV